MTTDPTIMSILAGESYARLSGTGDPYKVVMMGTNDGFWRIFDFTFVDGRPFGEAEFQSAVPRAVISSSLARKLFSRTDVSGQAFLLDDVEYIVSGVVKDVSYITPAVVADLWVPYSCLPTVMETGSSEREASLGFLVGCILPARGVSEEEVAHELDEQIRLYNSTLRDGKIRLMNGLEAHGRHVVSQFAGGSIGSGASGANGMNPVNVLYFVFFLLILLFRNLLLVPGVFVMMTGGANMDLTPGMMLNLPVFGYAFLVCLVLNFLSSSIPVWRAVRVNIIDAING